MAKNSRQQFVQAKLAATGKDATPELKAKLRERFNTLSQTKEGRTKIAQAVLPSGTASDRAALKKALRPPPKSTTTSTATSTTTSTAGVMGGVNTPSGSSASSAVVPGAKITPPTTVPTSTTVPRSTTSTTSTTVPRSTTSTTSTTVPRSTTTSTTSTTVPAAQKLKSNNLPSGAFQSFGPSGTPTVKTTSKPKDVVYGDQAAEKVALKLEQYNVPILGRVAGIGRNLDAGKNKEAGIGLLKAVALAATTRVLPQLVGAVKTGQLAVKTVRGLNKQNTSLQNEFRLSEALKYERTAENAQTFRRDFGTIAEQRAANPPPPGNKDFRFPSIADQQKAYVYKPPKTRAGQPGTSGKNFSLDEYGRPVKLPKNK